MLNKISQNKIIVMIIIIAISFVSCVASGGDSAKVEDLQQQVDALATQNAILLEESQDSDISNDSGEVDAPAPPSGNQDTQIEIVDPTPETLPDGPVPAGTPIFFDGWSMTVSQELTFSVGADYWGITIYIRNLDENSRVFRFVNAGITAKDNLGNIYEFGNPPSYSVSGQSGTCEENHHKIKNLEVKGNETTRINSLKGGYHQCSNNNGIHMFNGPIPLEVSEVIISFKNFGPFDNVDVIFEL